MTMYDCIVIGGGALGSATGLSLAKQGHKTLVLEQFTLPHSRGSSSGPSRMSHNTHVIEHHMAYTRDVQKTWTDLEEETNTVLTRKTGVLTLDVKNSPSAVRLQENLVKFNMPHQVLTTAQMMKKYPLLTYKGDYSILLEENTVVLAANKCLKTIRDYFLQKGGELRDGEKVLKIDPGRIVTVHTNKGRQYKARGLVITPGPWASELLKPLGLDLPLKVWRVNVCFFKEKKPGSYSDYPVMIDALETDGFIYHFPSSEYPGYMKLGFHLRWDEVTDPDKRDWNNRSKSKTQVDIEALKKYVQEHYPGLEPEPAIIEDCMYTCTPEEDIIIDRHPDYSNIAIGCGMSGKGFKIMLWAGQLLADLAMGKPLKYDIRPISMQRFLNPNAKL